jgi:hypothetical protein
MAPAALAAPQAEVTSNSNFEVHASVLHDCSCASSAASVASGAQCMPAWLLTEVQTLAMTICMHSICTSGARRAPHVHSAATGMCLTVPLPYYWHDAAYAKQNSCSWCIQNAAAKFFAANQQISLKNMTPCTPCTCLGPGSGQLLNYLSTAEHYSRWRQLCVHAQICVQGSAATAG